ncbi:hypothetical protein WR25_09405 [Diploscapter pachys]|uniref:SXP/RAL-2 family protein Ani s 5-like cation-binding domain-containing protein n=1 Tax=Diploscapter pachys TaxID=2018661 RepID=A0A2A2M1M6_9BILA|nr:hypothetical protein WR25_09405 [Diploscapter pachys]
MRSTLLAIALFAVFCNYATARPRPDITVMSKINPYDTDKAVDEYEKMPPNIKVILDQVAAVVMDRSLTIDQKMQKIDDIPIPENHEEDTEEEKKRFKSFLTAIHNTIEYYDKTLKPGLSPKAREFCEYLYGRLTKPSAYMENREKMSEGMETKMEGLGLDDVIDVFVTLAKIIKKAKEEKIVQLFEAF